MAATGQKAGDTLRTILGFSLIGTSSLGGGVHALQPVSIQSVDVFGGRANN